MDSPGSYDKLDEEALPSLAVQVHQGLPGQLAVSSATWAADDSSENRDGGESNLDNVFATCNGGDQYVRYRTGSSQSITTLLTLTQPSDVAGVSITVRASPDAEGEGYSGIEIAVSSGGDFIDVYLRHEMFGTFERGGTHETLASDFVQGEPTHHIFDSVASGVTRVRITMFVAGAPWGLRASLRLCHDAEP